jgi:hypothetical protein
MKYELRYFAQLYLGFEIFSKCPYWILPSNIAFVCLGQYEEKLKFQRLKLEYLELQSKNRMLR